MLIADVELWNFIHLDELKSRTFILFFSIQLQASISQAKHEKEIIKSRAKELIQEMKPLKAEVDAARFSIGLEKLPDMSDVDEAIFKSR